MSLKLELSGVGVHNIPSPEDVINAARQVVDSVENGTSNGWKPSKTYHINPGSKYQKLGVGIQVVQTFARSSAPDSGDPKWVMRVSTHPPEECSFDELWDGLGKDHALNELHYISQITEVTKLKTIEAGVSEVWHVYFGGLGPMITPRSNVNLTITRLETLRSGARQGWFVSIPFDTAGDDSLEAADKEASGTSVRGRLVAIEMLKELDDGRTEWRTAVCARLYGAIPDIFVQQGIAKIVAHDVPLYLKWVKSGRPERTLPSPPVSSVAFRVMVLVVVPAIAAYYVALSFAHPSMS